MSHTLNTRQEIITPKLARTYLAMNRSNRPIRKHLVSQLASLMKQGRFHESHQGIAFYNTGELADGQHRLSAIVESGMIVKMLVTRGLFPVANHAIDRGIARTSKDTLGFLGLKASNRDIAIARCIIQQHDMIVEGRGTWNSKTVPSERFSDNFSSLTECLEFSHALLSCPAPAAAAFAVAFFSESRDRLLEFAKIFNTGVCDSVNTDMAAILIRDFVLSKRYSLGNNGRQALFEKTCSAIRNFCRFHSPSRLNVCKSLAYTAPDGKVK